MEGINEILSVPTAPRLTTGVEGLAWRGQFGVLRLYCQAAHAWHGKLVVAFVACCPLCNLSERFAASNIKCIGAMTRVEQNG